MSDTISRVLLWIIFFLNQQCLLLAQSDIPHAVWLFPGTNWQSSEHVRLQNQLGYNDFLKTGIWYPQAYITLHKNWVLNPAYIYSIRKEHGVDRSKEHYLMNALILVVRKNKFLIEDRNMLWNRLTVGAEARHYYRNRLRVIHAMDSGSIKMRIYGYNEVFYLIGQQVVSRNRTAVGISSDIIAKLNLEVTYVRQWDRFTGRLNLYFIAVSWKW